MNDEYRETMYLASLKEHVLVKPRVLSKTVYDDVSLDEFKAIMIEKSPTAIYHTQYSQKKACWNITERIWPSHEGVYIVADAWADKEPRFMSWESFYRELKIGGFEFIKF